MSVCYFGSADQASTSTGVEEIVVVGDAEVEETISVDMAQQQLQQFWNKATEDVKKVTADDFKTQVLPLARIKKIMKLDEEVKMISAEAPVLFAKAAEIFIHELTMRAWYHTQDNKRRTLQRNDIAMAISKSDQFDFLIDIVPRQEVKPSKPRDDAPRVNLPTDQGLYCLQQPHGTAPAAPAAPHQLVLQPCTQLLQQTSPPQASTTSVSVTQQPSVAVVQQVVSPSGEVQSLQQLPLQLTQAQLNMIRMQIQNNPSQPIIIQAQPQQAQHTPQIIQVSSQAQPGQQIFLAQVATTQDDS